MCQGKCKSYVVFLNYRQLFFPRFKIVERHPFHSAAQSSIYLRDLPSPSSPELGIITLQHDSVQQLIQGLRKKLFYITNGFFKCILITLFVRLSLIYRICPTAFSAGLEWKKEMSNLSWSQLTDLDSISIQTTCSFTVWDFCSYR